MPDHRARRARGARGRRARIHALIVATRLPHRAAAVAQANRRRRTAVLHADAQRLVVAHLARLVRRTDLLARPATAGCRTRHTRILTPETLARQIRRAVRIAHALLPVRGALQFAVLVDRKSGLAHAHRSMSARLALFVAVAAAPLARIGAPAHRRTEERLRRAAGRCVAAFVVRTVRIGAALRSGRLAVGARRIHARRGVQGRRPGGGDDVALRITPALAVGPADETVRAGASRSMADGATQGVQAAGVRGSARIGAATLQAGLVGGARQVAGALVVCCIGWSAVVVRRTQAKRKLVHERVLILWLVEFGAKICCIKEYKRERLTDLRRLGRCGGV